MAVFPKPFGLLLLLCIFVHQALSIPQFQRPLTLELPSAEDEGKLWVVLVSGSKGWYDYEDQASVCRAWHMFIDNGVDPGNIITMMHDDIANNTRNPYPGKIFNHPNGSDVYGGVRIDYRGKDVSPENFMAVLLGNATATNGKPVLKSTKNDKVFVYYTDHGGSGVVAFPHRILTVKSLAETLEGMHEREMYKELTFYLSACQSGSMFLDKLPENIYAVTSTNAKEPGLRCFCDTKLIPGVCIGHVFSVVWMEDTEQEVPMPMPHHGIRIADYRHHHSAALPPQYAGMTPAQIEDAQLAWALQMSLEEAGNVANTAAPLNAEHISPAYAAGAGASSSHTMTEGGQFGHQQPPMEVAPNVVDGGPAAVQPTVEKTSPMEEQKDEEPKK